MINNIGFSAVRAFTSKFTATAHNIANVNTEGFKSIDVRLKEEKAGVGINIVQTESDVDVAKEMTNVILSKNGIALNLSVIKAENSIYKSIIDVIA